MPQTQPPADQLALETRRRRRVTVYMIAGAVVLSLCAAAIFVTLGWIIYQEDLSPAGGGVDGTSAAPTGIHGAPPPGGRVTPVATDGGDLETSASEAGGTGDGGAPGNERQRTAAAGERAAPTGTGTGTAGADTTRVRPAEPRMPEDPLDEDVVRVQLPISGHVFDDLGVPVPGLEIVAFPRHLFDQDEAEAMPPARQEQVSYTDFDGAYTLFDLDDGEYYVRALQTESYGPASVMVRAGTDRADLIVARQQPFRVYGVVRSVGGAPLARVRVLPVGQPLVAYTDEQGGYELRLMLTSSQRYQVLRFQANDYQIQEVRLEEAEWQAMDSRVLDVVLRPIAAGASVEGTVKTPDGTAVASETISLQSPSRRRRYSAVSDDGGRFSFDNVEIADDYRLWVRPKGPFQDYGASMLSVTPDGLALDIVLEPIDRGSLSGRILGPEGDPVPFFPLWLRSSTAWTHILQVTGDGNGNYRLDDVPTGDLAIETRSFPVFRVNGIRVQPGEHKDLDIVIDHGSYVIVGRVVDSYGEPVPGAEVHLYWSRDYDGVRSRSTRRAVAGVYGDFTFTELGAGRHTLSVRALGFRTAHRNLNVGGYAGEVEIVLDDLP